MAGLTLRGNLAGMVFIKVRENDSKKDPPPTRISRLPVVSPYSLHSPFASSTFSPRGQRNNPLRGAGWVARGPSAALHLTRRASPASFGLLSRRLQSVILAGHTSDMCAAIWHVEKLSLSRALRGCARTRTNGSPPDVITGAGGSTPPSPSPPPASAWSRRRVQHVSPLPGCPRRPGQLARRAPALPFRRLIGRDIRYRGKSSSRETARVGCIVVTRVPRPATPSCERVGIPDVSSRRVSFFSTVPPG